MKSNTFSRSIFVLIFVSFICSFGCTSEQDNKLRVLAWVGYDETEFLKPIEDSLGIDVDVKTYTSGSQMYSLFKQAPAGTYDLIVVDAEFGRKLFKEGALTTLEQEIWKDESLFQTFEDGSPVSVQDSIFAAVVRWGALGLVYNTEHLSEEEVSSYSILWDKKLDGKVGVYDWYLPNMGIFSTYLGFSPVFGISRDQLSILRDTLTALRPQVSSIHSNTGDVIDALRQGQAWISPGVGEWAAAVLAEEDRPFDWKIPEEGGVIWVEAFAIPKSSERKSLARQFIEAVRKPKHMARLTWRDAYHSQSPSRKAYKHLDKKQRTLLHAKDIATLDSLLKSITFRKLPSGPTQEEDWLRVWTAFKTSN